MLYRYRLSDGIDNKGLNSLSVEKVILKKNKWFYSSTPMFQKYIGTRVEEQTAYTMETFPLESNHRDDLVRQLKKHPKTELKRIAESIGIDSSDVYGVKKDDLIEMIADY